MLGIGDILARITARLTGRDALASSAIGTLSYRDAAGVELVDPASLADASHILQPEQSFEQPDATRLQRLARWCLEGNAAGAAIELHDWQRRAGAPGDTRVILAALLARRGDTDTAIALLSRGGADHEDLDRDALQLLVSLLMAQGLNDAARRAAQHLHSRYGHEPAVMEWLTAMHVPGLRELGPLPLSSVERLAAELVTHPDVIPTLVAAQKLDPEALTVQLLREAIGQIVRHLDEDRWLVPVCQAMAELALVANDQDDARRWAHRGLRKNAYCAPLALVLAKVSDDLTIGPAAARVLEEVAEANPRYHDVRAALIRRQRADGAAQSARMRLADWLERDPQNPVALGLQRELAA